MSKIILSNKTEIELLFNCWSLSDSNFNIMIESHDESIKEIKDKFKDNEYFDLVLDDETTIRLNQYSKINQVSLITNGHASYDEEGNFKMIDMWSIVFNKQI